MAQPTPNSPFAIRPFLLLAIKKNLDNVDFIIQNFINPPTFYYGTEWP